MIDRDLVDKQEDEDEDFQKQQKQQRQQQQQQQQQPQPQPQQQRKQQQQQQQQHKITTQGNNTRQQQDHTENTEDRGCSGNNRAERVPCTRSPPEEEEESKIIPRKYYYIKLFLIKYSIGVTHCCLHALWVHIVLYGDTNVQKMRKLHLSNIMRLLCLISLCIVFHSRMMRSDSYCKVIGGDTECPLQVSQLSRSSERNYFLSFVETLLHSIPPEPRIASEVGGKCLRSIS